MHSLYIGCLATNSLDFYEHTTLRYYGNYVSDVYLQKVWSCAADCNLCYMNKTLFTFIAFDYLLLTFRVKRPAKNTRYSLET